MKAFGIRRIAWIAELLRYRKHLTLKEIKEEWRNSYLSDETNKNIIRQTWHNCVNAIAEAFGIFIKSGKKRKWYIENPEVFEDRSVEQWMLSLMTYRNLIDECMTINDRFDLEDFPSENDRLAIIVQAMKSKKKLEVYYQKYQDNEVKRRIVEPYYIKTYEHRFYAICKEEDKAYLVILSFDRMVSVDITEESFHFITGTSAKDYFKDCFGVFRPEDGTKPVTITVRAYDDARDYLRDVPMHCSQKEIKKKKEYSDFQIYIYPTRDFTGYIIHQEDRLEIVSPPWLRKYMAEKYKRGLKRYQDCL